MKLFVRGHSEGRGEGSAIRVGVKQGEDEFFVKGSPFVPLLGNLDKTLGHPTPKSPVQVPVPGPTPTV